MDLLALHLDLLDLLLVDQLELLLDLLDLLLDLDV